MTKIAVFGAGTWGIALARLLAANGRDVTVWSAIPAELKSLSTTHRHPNLPGMELPAAMHYTADIAEACTGRDILLFAVPSPFVRATAKKAAPHIPEANSANISMMLTPIFKTDNAAARCSFTPSRSTSTFSCSMTKYSGSFKRSGSTSIRGNMRIRFETKPNARKPTPQRMPNRRAQLFEKDVPSFRMIGSASISTAE